MFPEPMNSFNKDFLKQCAINGPDIYPGAISYQINNKPPVAIFKDRVSMAEQLELQFQRGNRVIINRHAISDDVLIMNRQPTLHRPSMQAHLIKPILDPRAKTLRMHYSNCKAYNADFDGDEMNGHYMQSIKAQAEAKVISELHSISIINFLVLYSQCMPSAQHTQGWVPIGWFDSRSRYCRHENVHARLLLGTTRIFGPCHVRIEE